MSEGVPLIMAQSWPWGSQIAVKKKKIRVVVFHFPSNSLTHHLGQLTPPITEPPLTLPNRFLKIFHPSILDGKGACYQTIILKEAAAVFPIPNGWYNFFKAFFANSLVLVWIKSSIWMKSCFVIYLNDSSRAISCIIHRYSFIYR